MGDRNLDVWVSDQLYALIGAPPGLRLVGEGGWGGCLRGRGGIAGWLRRVPCG